MSIVVISPYSADWPKYFSVLHDELLSVFMPTVVAVEHIGSTAVPGLAAKPVIDVLLGANSLAEIEAKIKPLSELGYLYVPKYEREIPMRRYFVKSSATALRVHMHAVETGSRLWREHLAFRDALRGNSTLRNQYQSLKLQLAQAFADDKSSYTAAKHPFIQSVLGVALDKNN
jgi:GrpB-like predicted nucleotidyltransferase (UPF0157 family)